MVEASSRNVMIKAAGRNNSLRNWYAVAIMEDPMILLAVLALFQDSGMTIMHYQSAKQRLVKA